MRDLYNDFINELQLFDTNEMCNHFFQLKQNVEAHKDHHEELMPHLSQAAEAIRITIFIYIIYIYIYIYNKL